MLSNVEGSVVRKLASGSRFDRMWLDNFEFYC